MINVEQINENEFTISWDENSPTESILNTWTEDDFIRAIKQSIEALNEEDTKN